MEIQDSIRKYRSNAISVDLSGELSIMISPLKRISPHLKYSSIATNKTSIHPRTTSLKVEHFQIKLSDDALLLLTWPRMILSPGYPFADNFRGLIDLSSRSKMPPQYAATASAIGTREMPKVYARVNVIISAPKEKAIAMDMLAHADMFIPHELSSRLTHMTEQSRRIHRRIGVPSNSILFFSDELYECLHGLKNGSNKHFGG
ncbi:hypothetical protein C5167_031604 [Papaver somniferum]|uniref:Uncharacterized protein n=1 Tax=Papaver somniferum TaxID=3469 RepID=A0A4Y7K8L7_PAPSO|nr:hypothetical protein C5167_031604 [Papaver somniferum]